MKQFMEARLIGSGTLIQKFRHIHLLLLQFVNFRHSPFHFRPVQFFFPAANNPNSMVNGRQTEEAIQGFSVQNLQFFPEIIKCQGCFQKNLMGISSSAFHTLPIKSTKKRIFRPICPDQQLFLFPFDPETNLILFFSSMSLLPFSFLSLWQPHTP